MSLKYNGTSDARRLQNHFHKSVKDNAIRSARQVPPLYHLLEYTSTLFDDDW